MDKSEVFIDDDLIPEKQLPEKSRDLYKKMYNKFCNWRTKEKISNVTEAVILKYILVLNQTMKPSTLGSYCSILKSSLMAYENIDIGKFQKVKVYLKQNSKGFKSKKSKAFTHHEVIRFINKAPDEVYLLMKAVLVIGIAGGCRIGELVNMKVDDIDDRGSVVVITLPATKTNQPREFTLINDSTISAIDIYRKYLKLRPNNVAHRRLLLNYQRGKCTVQPVGENKLYKMPNGIAKFLGIPEPSLYTGQTFRRTSAALLENGTGLLEFKWHSGSSSSMVADNDSEDSLQACEKILDCTRSHRIDSLSPSEKRPRLQENSFTNRGELRRGGRSLRQQSHEEIAIFVKSISSQIQTLPRSVCVPLFREIEQLIAGKMRFLVHAVEGSDGASEEEVFVKSEIDIEENFVKEEIDVHENDVIKQEVAD